MKKFLSVILIFLAVIALSSVINPFTKDYAEASTFTVDIIFNPSSICYIAKNPDNSEKLSIINNGNNTYTATITIISECSVRKFSVRDKNSNIYKDVARGISNPEGGEFTISFIIDQAMLDNSVFYENEYQIQLFPDGMDSEVYTCSIGNINLSEFNYNISVSEGDLVTDMGENLVLKLFSGETVNLETVKIGAKNLYSLRGGPAESYFDSNGKASFTMPPNDLSLDAVYGSYLTLLSDDAGHMDTAKSKFTIKNESNIAFSGESVTLTVYPLLSGEHKGYVVSKLIKESDSGLVNVFEYETGAASYFERKADGAVTYTFTMGDEDISLKPVFDNPVFEITFGDTIAGEGILSAYDIELINNDTVPRAVYKLSEAIEGRKIYAHFGDSLTYKIYVADTVKYYIKDTEMSVDLKRSLAYLYQSDEDGEYNHDTGVSVVMTQGKAEITVGNILNKTYGVILNEKSQKTETAYLIRTGESEKYNSAEYPWDQAKPIYLKPAPGYKFSSTPYFIKNNDETHQMNAFVTSVEGWYFYLEADAVTVYFATEKIPLTASIASAGGDEECNSVLEVEREGKIFSSEEGKLVCFVGEVVKIKTFPSLNYEISSINANNTSLTENTFVMGGKNVSVVVNFYLHRSEALPPEIELIGINASDTVFNTVGLTGEILSNYSEGFDLKLKIKNAELPVNIETLKEYFCAEVYNFAGKRIAVKELSVYAVEISLDLIHFSTEETYTGEMAGNKKLAIYLPVKSDASGKDFTYIARYNKQNGEMTLLKTNRRTQSGQVYYDFNADEFTTYIVLACNYDPEASVNLSGSIEADGLNDPMFNRVIYGGVLPENPNEGGKNNLEWYYILLIVLGSLAVAAGITVFALFKCGKLPPLKKKRKSRKREKSDA